MARIGYKYYIIVDDPSGRLLSNCTECKLVRSSTSQPIQGVIPGHTVIDSNHTDFNIMTEVDDNGNFKNKWDKGQGKPVEDI